MDVLKILQIYRETIKFNVSNSLRRRKLGNITHYLHTFSVTSKVSIKRIYIVSFHTICSVKCQTDTLQKRFIYDKPCKKSIISPKVPIPERVHCIPK